MNSFVACLIGLLVIVVSLEAVPTANTTTENDPEASGAESTESDPLPIDEYENVSYTDVDPDVVTVDPSGHVFATYSHGKWRVIIIL